MAPDAGSGPAGTSSATTAFRNSRLVDDPHGRGLVQPADGVEPGVRAGRRAPGRRRRLPGSDRRGWPRARCMRGSAASAGAPPSLDSRRGTGLRHHLPSTARVRRRPPLDHPRRGPCAQRGTSPRGLRRPRRRRRDRGRAGVRRVVRGDRPAAGPGEGLGRRRHPRLRQPAARPAGRSRGVRRGGRGSRGHGPREQPLLRRRDRGRGHRGRSRSCPTLPPTTGCLGSSSAPASPSATSAIAGGSRSTWTRRWTPS